LLSFAIFQILKADRIKQTYAFVVATAPGRVFHKLFVIAKHWQNGGARVLIGNTQRSEQRHEVKIP
jgi:hypothetical protein